MRPLFLALLASPLLTVAEPVVTRVACGSCYKPGKDAGIWKTIATTDPQLFLFMGDNVYADTADMALMKKRYAELTGNPGFAKFRDEVRVLPIWDDHDYGRNDAGADYAPRAASQKIFLDTFRFPADHPARATPGVYHSWISGPPGKRLQVILLDTRYFRSALRQERVNGRKTYLPVTEPSATMLGKEQWRWLEAELRKPADLRFLVSSIQVLTTEHRFEKWENLPNERKRLLALLEKTGTKRVVLFSGDRHLAEAARLPAAESGLPYDLWELTSSGMTHAAAPNDPNRLRIGEPWTNLNFGTVGIDWSGKTPAVDLEIRDQDGKVVQAHEVRFPE